MLRTTGKLLLLLFVLFGLWQGLAHIPWRTQASELVREKSIEDKLGKLYWNYLQQISKENKDSLSNAVLQQMVNRLCKYNKLDSSRYTVHLMKSSEINAFALPGRHLVVNTELLAFVDTPEQLAGVLAHEIAHQELNHIMQTLLRELGATALLSMVTGQSSGTMIGQTAMDALTRSFNRDMENDADRQGIRYMANAGMEPNQFAAFLMKMMVQEKKLPAAMHWMSTHPELNHRIEKVIASADSLTVTNPQEILPAETWDQIQKRFQTNNISTENPYTKP